MKVAIASNLFPPNAIGGAEVLAHTLARDLSTRMEVHVISTAGPWEGNAPAKDGPYQIHLFRPGNLYWQPESKTKPKAMRAAWHLIDCWNPVSRLKFGRILDEVQPDILHTHNIDGMSPSIWSAAEAREVPIVHTAHDYHLLCPSSTALLGNGKPCEHQRRPACRMYRAWYARAVRRIDAFAAPSQFMLDQHRNLGMKPKEWHLVRNGLPLPEGPQPHTEQDVFRILYVGQLVPHKGITDLLAAFRNLRIPAARLDIIGTGVLTSQIQAAARADARIRVHGWLGDVQKKELLRMASVFVHPAVWNENAPLTIIEAMQHGVPVVASRIGGIPELVADGETGYLFTPGDTQALADFLSRLAEDRNLLRRLSLHSLEAGRSMDVRTMAMAYQSIYEGLV